MTTYQKTALSLSIKYFRLFLKETLITIRQSYRATKYTTRYDIIKQEQKTYSLLQEKYGD